MRTLGVLGNWSSRKAESGAESWNGTNNKNDRLFATFDLCLYVLT